MVEPLLRWAQNLLVKPNICIKIQKKLFHLNLLKVDMNDEVRERIAEMQNGYLGLTELGLTELPPLPDTVRQLDCNWNELTRLPRLPEGLHILNCDQNELTELPTLPSTLRELYCSGNQLSSLPRLPQGLEKLDIEQNTLTTLPTLPSTLKWLYCSANELTSLPELPKRLESLSCSYNLVTSLPSLPQTLDELDCRECGLSSIPKLPPSLKRLYCDWNELAYLPPLPESLESITCTFNPFTYPFDTYVDVFNSGYGGVELLRNRVNAFWASKKPLKEGIVAARFDPRKIQANMNRNQINPNTPISEENLSKYYKKRGEVWTEGVGTKKGGKRKSRKTKRKQRKTRKYTRKTL